MINRFLISVLILSAAGLWGCSKEFRQYTSWSNKGSLAEKDSAAFFFLGRKDYEKAAYLFEELLPAYRGSERAKDILYHLAYCKYEFGTYQVAAYRFEEYTTQYPNDVRTAECTFMIGYCYYLESSPYYLDQAFTKQALERLQLFAYRYPDSDKIKKCNELMSDLRERLANKEMKQAELYFNMQNYKSAVTAYEVAIQEYPDSRYREQAQFMLFKSAYYLAGASTIARQQNRYLDALDYYKRYKDKYPTGLYEKEAEQLYAQARKALGKLQATAVQP
ncbi:MAG: outer membrane protein assembly factor BamD [Bacteroidia bacterium]|nr:outer membrane protein assembly factor BamD [Bacteroidia bacterium]